MDQTVLSVSSSSVLPDWVLDCPDLYIPADRLCYGSLYRNTPLMPHMPRSLKVSTVDIKSNARIKSYLRKDVLQVANDCVFSAKGWERTRAIKGKRNIVIDQQNTEEELSESDKTHTPENDDKPVDKERSMQESRRRAKSAVVDIANMNEFTHMFTWTIDPAMMDRYDPKVVYRHVRNFLSNMGRRKGFKYVLIPEYHKKKDDEVRPALHFHGLCILGDVQCVPAFNKLTGKEIRTKTGRPVLNMIDWKYGHSTVVPLDDNYDKAVSYCAKYITKSDEKIFGKWYLSSRFIDKKPEIIIVEPVVYDHFRDEYKLAKKIQFEVNVYFDVKIISEEIPHDDVFRGAGCRSRCSPGVG